MRRRDGAVLLLLLFVYVLLQAAAVRGRSKTFPPRGAVTAMIAAVQDA